MPVSQHQAGGSDPVAGTLPRRGMTVMELLVTLTVLSAASLIVIPRLVGRGQQASMETTQRTLETIRSVILNEYRDDLFESLPYPIDPQRIRHPQLKYLFHNPSADPTSYPDATQWSHDKVTGRGWAGPYLEHSSLATVGYRVDASRGFTRNYGEEPGGPSEFDDPAPSDAWGNPIVLQQPVVDGSVHSPVSMLYARLVSAGPDGVLQTPLTVPQPTASQSGDDLVLFLEVR